MNKPLFPVYLRRENIARMKKWKEKKKFLHQQINESQLIASEKHDDRETRTINVFISTHKFYLCETFLNQPLTFVTHHRGDSRSNIPVATAVFVPPLP